MGRSLDFSWTYDVAPLPMFWMLTRLDHLEAKAEYLGHAEHRVVELRERDGMFRSVTQRRVDVTLPGWAKMFQPRNRITQRQHWRPPAWDGARRYDTWVEIQQVPVSIAGVGRLTPAGIGGTRYDIHLNLDSRMPIFGRRLRDFVAEQFLDVVEREHEFREIWLARRQADGFRR